MPIDAEVGFEELESGAVEDLARLEPFGHGNRRPRFCGRGLVLKAASAFGPDREHLRLWLSGANLVVEAIADLKDETLRATFTQSNRRAAMALADYAAWLEKEKLPKATPQFAIGEEKYQRFLAETEMVNLPPAKILELGLAELKNEQIVFRYTSVDGKDDAAGNPNGSMESIAGICNRERNVAGLMPHPERAVESALDSADGLVIFRSMVESLVTSAKASA